MNTHELQESYGTLGPAHDRGRCASAGGACGSTRHVGQPLDLDPVDVFAKLVREVDAGRALVTMTPAGDVRRAALDALALARDVLDDARLYLDDPAAPLPRFSRTVTVNRCDLFHTGPRCPEDHAHE